MHSPKAELLNAAKSFVILQHSLLEMWQRIHPESHDLVMLLDFPKHSVVELNSEAWTAQRHGAGVRFVRMDGLTVDVPTDVNQSYAVDPGRLFDFVVSHPTQNYELLPRDRASFSKIFLELVQSELFFMLGKSSEGTRLWIPADRAFRGN